MAGMLGAFGRNTEALAEDKRAAEILARTLGTEHPDSYRIESDLPVTAHQFNPLSNVGAFSNDASLLLPAAALGTGYRALAWPQSDASALPGFVTIVAAAEGATAVTVTVSTATRAGIDYPAMAVGLPWSIPAMSPGEQATRVLKQYEAFSLQTASYGQDLSGSVITADQPVAVFAGAECANVPLGVGACDHLEEQLYPVGTWGQSYLAVKSRPRGTEPDLWRILADENGTTVTTDPPQAGTPATLQAGQVLYIVTTASFRIDATAPVLVGEFLVGQDYAGGSSTGYTGDPSYLLAVPVEQFRVEYVFLTPSGYTYDSVTIAAPLDAEVSLDGVPIPASSFAPVGTTGWARAAIDLTDGVHRLESEVAFGASVTGYDTYVSYGYPAGMDLEVLSP